MIYNGYMQTLIGSYEKLKGKFNNFAAKCLSERQKRESGLILVAPPLVLPAEKEMEDQNTGNGHKEEEKKGNVMISHAKENGRMGGRLGVKMEKVSRKQEDNGPAYASRGGAMKKDMDNDSIGVDDEEEIADDDMGSGNRKRLNGQKNLVEREPEREPDFSAFEGNVSQSIIENDNKKQIHSSNIPPASKQVIKANQLKLKPPKEEDNIVPMDDEGMYNLSQEGSLNISETNDSMLELKKVSAIPILKSNDQIKNKINKDKDSEKALVTLTFSQRVNSTDPYRISFQLVQDINLVSSQVF